MEFLEKIKFLPDHPSEEMALRWKSFLTNQEFDFSKISLIDFTQGSLPEIYDLQRNRFCIDFLKDKRNYHKKKSSIQGELIGRAFGSGRLGLRLLDLTAGLGIDSVFLAQLGFEVTAIERNPLIYLALSEALLKIGNKPKLEFVFAQAKVFLESLDFSEKFDLIYFDPMFPEKSKSALPRQEMVFFRNLVGDDSDGLEVLKKCLSLTGIKRVVVKRPIHAKPLLEKFQGQLCGKLVRFDFYRPKGV